MQELFTRNCAPNYELVREASRTLAAPESPVRYAQIERDELLSIQFDADIYLVSETEQTTGAYKIRGAYNRFLNRTAEEEDKEVVAISAGNHAQAVAVCANLFETYSTIFMPKDTPSYKVERVKQFGGQLVKVVLSGSTVDKTLEIAKNYMDDHDAILVHPFDDPYVIAGQGTLGIEVADDLPEVDVVLCPVGGGGLISGLSIALSNKSGAQLIGIEPEGAACLAHALLQRRPESIPDQLDTFVDGAAVAKFGSLPFEILSQAPNLSSVKSVGNLLLRKVTTELWNRDIQAELAGALSVSGLYKAQEMVRGKTVACVVSGGNLDTDRFNRKVRL